MSKAPSDTTQLRRLKFDYKRLKLEFNQMGQERDNYRARATKAEQDAKQWKERFDILLRRENK